MASSRKSRSADRPAALVAASLARHAAPGASLCVGLSGGVDSVVLLHLLHRLQPRSDFTLSAAHVHHGLNPRADDWCAFCEALCSRLGIAFRQFQVTPPGSSGRGVESAARDARYAALSRLEVDWLVLGHHRDDQAETVLFKLLRGAGLRGMSGISEAERRVDGPSLLRPMLALGRDDILAWAHARGLAWVEDDSNADERFARNFLRGSVLPLLRTRFPAASVAISRAAGHLRESQELLDELAGMDLRGVGGDDAMGVEAFAALPEARRRNLIRWRLRALGFQAPDEALLREAIRQLEAQGPGKPLYFPIGQARLCRYRQKLWIERDLQMPEPGVPWRGEENLLWGDDKVVFQPCRGRGLDLASIAGRDVVLDLRRSGDCMRIGAGRPARSFKNLVQEAGIPPWLREVLPVLRVDGAPAWIAGIGVAQEYACPPGGEGVLPAWKRAKERFSPRSDPA